MVRCANCGAESSPGATCAACDAPLATGAAAGAHPAPAAPFAGAASAHARTEPPAARWLAWGLVGVGGLLAFAGLVFISSMWPFVWGPHLMFLAMAAVAFAGGLGILRGETWGWALGWTIVVAGVMYALWGLSRGHGAGILGLAAWATASYALLRSDVRSHCGIGRG